MKLTDYATLNENTFSGKKLTKPQLNLLAKLDGMGVTVESNLPRVVVNQVSGYSAPLTSFIATLVEWVYETYASYNFSGAMNYRGTPVAIGTFDRVRHLILAVDSRAFSNFID